MDKLNRNIVNIIFSYIKPLHYLKELQESIKYIKYDKVFYFHKLYKNDMKDCIININNKWNRGGLETDYRKLYLFNNKSIPFRL